MISRRVCFVEAISKQYHRSSQNAVLQLSGAYKARFVRNILETAAQRCFAL